MKIDRDMSTVRDSSLDYAKGFAINLIVIYHLYSFFDRNVGSLVYDFCHAIQLPIFFYISGFLVRTSINNNRFQLRRKAVRLLLPFIMFYLIWGLIDKQNFVNFVFDEFKLGYWFVLVLFEMMICYTAIKSIKNSLYSHIVFMIALSLYEFLIPHDNLLNIFLCSNLLWHYYPFFLIGIYSDRIRKIMQLKYCVIFFLVFLTAFYLYITYRYKPLVPICNLASLFLFMTLFTNIKLPMKKYYCKVGVYSLQIYLVHFLIIHSICIYLPMTSNRLIEFAYYFVLANLIIILILYLSVFTLKYKWISLLLFGFQQNISFK